MLCSSGAAGRARSRRPRRLYGNPTSPLPGCLIDNESETPTPRTMPRIISLIASATEIVNSLGQIDNLVGRSHECDYPDRVKSLPVCTCPRIPVNGSSREIDQLVKQSARTSVSIYQV